MACWNLLKVTERLHNHGLASFSIFDQETLDKAAKEARFTFAQRINIMCDYLRFTKGKVDRLLKGDGVETFVAIAAGKLKECKLGSGIKKPVEQTSSGPSKSSAPSTPSAPSASLVLSAPSHEDAESEEQPVPSPMPDAAMD